MYPWRVFMPNYKFRKSCASTKFRHFQRNKLSALAPEPCQFDPAQLTASLFPATGSGKLAVLKMDVEMPPWHVDLTRFEWGAESQVEVNKPQGEGRRKRRQARRPISEVA